jgi:DNA polymerase-1
VLVYFSQGPLYRNEVWPAYKSNRKGKRKPILLGKLIDWFKFESDFLTYWIPGLEADDLLGMGGYRRADTVICTIDKDLHTVEGFHYNWDKPELGVTMGSAYDASLQFYTQCLTGDSVDGFPGCPTVGPKTAAKILDGSESSDEMWQRVVATYEKKGLAEADAIVQARCAYILKLPNDIDEKGNVNLWTP